MTTGGARAFVWPNTIDQIEQDLKAEDAGTRRAAAQRLGELPESVARRLILQALGDADDEVRLAAAEAAVDQRLGAAAVRVIPWLNDSERRLRLVAAELLRHAPEPRAVAPLARVLSDQDAAVRAAAAAALGESGDPVAATALLGHLDDPMPSVREVVVEALARLRDPSAVVPLIGKIQDSRVGVRRRVAAALGELGDARAASALLLALQDSDAEVVVEALGALGKLKSEASAGAIVSLLENHDDAAVRLAAVRALARVGSSRSVDALIDALEASYQGVSTDAVVEALASVGPAAVPRLRQCLSGQPSAALADGCARTLGRLGDPGTTQVLTHALRRGVVRPPVALAALAELGRPESVPLVLEFLSDADGSVRQAAIESAIRLLDPQRPDGRAVEPIARALTAPSIPVDERARLAELLGRTGSKRAVALLEPFAANSDNQSLRVAAIRALGSIAPAGQDRVLMEALDAPSASVRWAAAVALRSAASGASVRPLLDRLERRSEQDRVALVVALGGALARNRNSSHVKRVVELVDRSRGAERDALIEALGHVPGALGSQPLERLAERSPAIADRAKVAEALARHPEALPTLKKLALDVDGSVRANAVWSLGVVGSATEIPLLRHALTDSDVAVAGNAAAALGRLEKSSGALCQALKDPRAYVRSNALGGLVAASQRCPDGRERDLLTDDPAAVVRMAAARLLARVPGPSSNVGPTDAELLERCAETDREGAVATACSAPAPASDPGVEAVTVYVVPAGHASPTPRAPFALVLSDGLMRLGITDRRGVVHEAAAPRGVVSLAVPAPLAR